MKELGCSVSVFPIPAVSHYALHVHTIEWNAGMGHTDTLHSYSCFCSFSIPTSKTSNKNIHFEMILDVGIGEKRKETRFLI